MGPALASSPQAVGQPSQPIQQPVVPIAQRPLMDGIKPPAASYAPQPLPSPYAPPAQQQPYRQQPAQSAYQPQVPQLVTDIPVKAPASQPAPAPTHHVPSAGVPQASPYAAQANIGQYQTYQPAMDDILKDVNRAVKKPEAVKKNKFKTLFSAANPIHLPKKAAAAVSQPKPALVIGLSVIAFISLSAAAYLAFAGNKDAAPLPEVKVVGTSAAAGDSIQASGGKLVSPQQVEEMTNTLKQQLYNFNESQDFNPEPLSDQSLGL